MNISSLNGLPEYLYHMTSLENANNIIKDKVMKGSYWESDEFQREVGNSPERASNMPGKYFVSKNNFLQKWLGTEFYGGKSVGEVLMTWVIRDKNIAAIEIPTKAFDLLKLRFRPYITACSEAIRNVGQVQTNSISKNGLSLSELSNYIEKEPVEFVYKGEVRSNLFSNIFKSKTNLPIGEIIKNLFKFAK